MTDTQKEQTKKTVLSVNEQKCIVITTIKMVHDQNMFYSQKHLRTANSKQ